MLEARDTARREATLRGVQSGGDSRSEGVVTQLALRQYQVDAIDRTLTAADRGVRKQLGVAATGLGKQQPIDEPVLTPGGWRPIGALEPGDLVIGADGKSTAVLSVHPQGEQPVMRVEFTDGTATRCGPEHLWTTRTKYDKHRGRPWRTVEALDLRPGWQIPLMEPAHLDSVPLPIAPYMLGVLLGDGSLGLPHLSVSTDRWIAEHLGWDQWLHPHKTSAYTVEGPLKDGALRAAVKSLGLWGHRSSEKYVPWIYRLGHPDDRLALLRGLMDTDGYAMPSGGAEFSSTAPALIEAVAWLARSLGGIARVSDGRVTEYTHNGERRKGHLSWRVNVKMPAHLCPFALPRKRDAWVAPTKYLPTKVVARVVHDGGAVEQVCIKIANDDGLYITRDFIVTHNTIVFASLARRMNCRTLVLAHRDELVSQAADKIRGQWPDASIGIVKAERNERSADVVVASVQTLARPKRLAQFIGQQGGFFGPNLFGLVVCDEAHHGKAETYQAIFAALRCGEPDGPLLLGVTATPDRGDGQGLDDVFDEVTWTYDILWGIRSGFLCDVRGKRVVIDTLDLAGVKTRRGDYVEGEVGGRMMDAGAPAAIARAWREHASDRRTLVFSPTVETADAVAAEMVALGARCAMVSGKTPLDERRQILRDFESGVIQVVSNCMVLTEGYDNPAVDCIICARPTKSRALYTQMVGRGTRRHPDKTDLLVLDVVGVSAEHSLITVPSLFGVTDAKARRKLETGEASAVEVLDEVEQELVRAGVLRAEDVELFHKIRTDIAWVEVHKPGSARLYQRSMGTDRATGAERPTVRLVQLAQGEDRYSCSLRIPTEKGSTVQALIVDVPLETAQAVGEDWIRAQGGLGLVASNAPWRQRDPSPKALAFARSLGVKVGPEIKAGELSDLIDAAKARKKFR